MEKKIKFSDKSKVSKIVYVTVIAILCVSAVVIGIVAAGSRKQTDVEEPPVTDGEGDGANNGTGDGNADQNANGSVNPDGTGTPSPEIKLTFVSPATGRVMKSHSTTVPVFSNTLEEWRIHTGIDILTDEGAQVAAAAAGTVSAVYYDPMLGNTVELTHSDTHKSYYSNLDPDSISVAVGDSVASGAALGKVGDSAIYELADEPHLHFELKVSGVSVNPLDYITEESKEASLNIKNGSAA